MEFQDLKINEDTIEALNTIGVAIGDLHEVVTMINQSPLVWPMINYIGTKDQCLQYVVNHPEAEGAIVRPLVLGGFNKVNPIYDLSCTVMIGAE